MSRPPMFVRQDPLTRRAFLRRTGGGIGMAALASLVNPELLSASSASSSAALRGTLDLAHFTPRAKRVIYLFMAGGPSQMETFDPKPTLNRLHGQDMPASVVKMQNVTLMTRNQKRFLCAGSPFKFERCGNSGVTISDLLPHTRKIADELCVVRSVHSEPINHDPAVTFMQTGSMVAGRPCIGSWLTYGLGSENSNLPGFVVMLSGSPDQPVLSRYYHSGFLPSTYQGVQFQNTGDPVVYLSNPPGVSHENRGRLVEAINRLNAAHLGAVPDPEIQTRIDQFELAYRMQTSVPELTDLASEPKSVLDLYGPDALTPGTFARNCLMARRLVERGVRFVQLYHRGWDQHDNLPDNIKRQCAETDRATAGLVLDLKRRGLLDDTIVVWGGEFGRTSFSQGVLTATNFGRDHHPRCFSVWFAGGGFKGGTQYGETDEFGYSVAENPVHVNDLHATLLHQMGIDHERLTYRFQGRDFRLTDVAGRVVSPLLS